MRAGDPIRNFRFKIEMGESLGGGFSEVSGFDLSIDVVKYHEDGQPMTPTRQPGLIKYSNITLKAGIVNQGLYTWIIQCVGGSIERKTIVLNAYGEEDADTVIASWSIENAWPVKYTAPDFNVTGNDVAVESLELAHESLRRTL